jgi:Fe-S-cluster containining protein
MTFEYRLTTVDQFKCLAGDCPASCCRGNWDIDVDTGTLQRWASLSDTEGRAQLVDSIWEKPSRGAPVQVLKKSAEGHCVHLDADNLCTIQRSLGEHMLPQTCRTYPRVLHERNGVNVTAATPSCPEIARLVVLGRLPEVRPVDDTPASAISAADPVAAYLLDTLSATLAQGKFPLRVKIVYLGRTLCRLAAMSARDQLGEQDLAALRGTLKQEMFDINVTVKNQRLRPDPAVAGAFWNMLLRLADTRELLGPEARAQAGRRLPGLSDSRNKTAGELSAAYDELSTLHAEAHARPGAELDSALHNYLLVSLLSRGFPLNPVGGNFVASFLSGIIAFSLVQLQSWLLTPVRGALEAGELVELIYRTERRIGHNTLIYRHLEQNPELLHLDRYLDCLIDIA